MMVLVAVVVSVLILAPVVSVGHALYQGLVKKKHPLTGRDL